MLVIAHHFVHDSNAFWSAAQAAMPSIPANLKLHSVFPSKDMKTGTCIWEASSAGESQDFLDNSFGDIVKNVCYEVNEEAAYGLPQKKMEEAVS